MSSPLTTIWLSHIIIIIIMLTVICRQNILRTITIKEVLIFVTNIIGSDSLESVRIFFVSFKALII
jgi:hypothetical protein